MEFPPVEVEELRDIVRLTKPVVVEAIRGLGNRLKELNDRKEPDDEKARENEDEKDCIREAIVILYDQTQGKKSSYLAKFVENTLITPVRQMEPATIFHFLKDIEQMTWRQLCLLEGFFRNENSNFTINGRSDSDVNGISIKIEIEKLINLNYLRSDSNDPDWVPIKFDEIYITQLGKDFSSLLGLHSVEIDEIGIAFGKGKITVIDKRKV